MGVIHYSNMSKLLQKVNHLHLHSTLDRISVLYEIIRSATEIGRVKKFTGLNADQQY